MKDTAKPHKYNVGDEITVKIAVVTTAGSKAAYRIKGIENIKISEGAIEKMSIKKSKPGDIVYGVCKSDWDEIIYFDAYKVEDIGYTEVKISGDWMSIDDSLFFDEKVAEEKAVALAKEYGFRISKGGLFKQEADNDGNESDSYGL